MREPLLLALLSAWPAFSQVSFTRTDIAIGQLASPSLVADFNHDGIADIAILIPNSLSIFMGNGDGTFQAPKVTTIPITPTNIAVADFNHDGNQDIISGDLGGSKPVVLLGKGDGTFQSPITLSFNIGPVAVGDLNGDGKPDLATAAPFESIYVALGNGDGTFGTPVPYPVRVNQTGLFGSTLRVMISDVNRDGRLDVVAIDRARHDMSILLGNGDGTLQPPVTYPGLPDQLVFDAAIADVNGDGSPDVVVATGPGVALYKGNGDGTFQGIQSVSPEMDNIDSIAIGDVNGDGLPDVVTASYTGLSFVSVLLGTGNGSFQAPISITVDGFPQALALADLNGDLNLDILTGNLAQDTTVLLNNNPEAVRVSPTSGGGISQTFAFTFSDPNGPTGIVSAHIDINATLIPNGACYIAYSRASNSIALANDQGTFQSPLTIGAAGTTQNSQCALNAGASSTTTSGKLLTLNLAVTFQPSFAGAKNVFMDINDGTHDSGWVVRGTWTVGSNLTPDFSFSLTPASHQTVVVGANATYTVRATSINGFNSVVTFQASGLPSGASASFNSPSVTGSGSSILTIQTSGGTPLGTTTITATGLSSSLNHHANGSLSVTVNNGPPGPVLVNPSGGEGDSGSFGLTYYNPGGVARIVAAQVNFNASTAIVGSCYVSFNPAANTIALANDAGTLQTPLTVGSEGTTENSQCIVDAGASLTSTFGNMVSLILRVQFKASFVGARNTYMKVFNGVQDSGWQQMGTWKIPFEPPDFFLVMSAGPESLVAGGSATYTVTVNPTHGFTGTVGFATIGLPTGVTGSFNPTSVTGSGSTTLTITTTANTPPANVTVEVVGTSGSVQHNAAGGLTISTSLGPPAPASVTPNTGSGSTQVFSFAFTDPNLAFDIASAQIDISATLSATSACYLFFVHGTNAIYLATDQGVWQQPLTLGNSGILQNSQCLLDVGASSVSVSTLGTTLTLNLALSFKAGFTGTKNIYMEVRSATADSGWSLAGNWTVGGVSPAPDFSVGMSAGPGSVPAGASPPYTVTVTGNNGFSGTVGFVVSGLPSGVTGSFNPATVTGSGSTTLTISTIGAASASFTITVTGTSGALQHSTTASLTITSVSAGPPAAVSVSPNTGTGLAQTFAFTFTDPNGEPGITSVQMDINATLAVANACYLYYVRGTNALYLASDAGAWQGPRSIGSAGTLQNSQCMVDAGGSSVSTGSTLTLNLALTFKAAFAGAKNVYMEVRSAAADSGWSPKGSWTVGSGAPPPDFSIGMTAGPGTVVAGASPTYTVTVNGANGFAGLVSFGVSGLPAGVTGSFNPTTVTGSGSTTLTLSTTGAASSSLTITVTGTNGALQHNTTAGLSITGASGGPPVPTSVSPNAGTGLTQTFVFTFTAPNGATDITSAQVDINASLAVANACYLFYVRAPNQLYLASDAGAWQGPITLGGSGILQNSQCSVSASGSSATPSGNTLILDLALTFKAAFSGAKNVYMEVKNASHDSGWSLEGTWTAGSGGQIAAPPAPVSVTPNTGSGTSHTFAFAFSDPNGATDIVSAQMDINATLAVPNACYLYYVRAANTIYLASDTGVWQGPLTIGSAGTLQNNQCSINSATSSVTAVGNTLTVNLALTFKAAFTGSKNVYMEVRDATHDSGWSLEGSWTP